MTVVLVALFWPITLVILKMSSDLPPFGKTKLCSKWKHETVAVPGHFYGVIKSDDPNDPWIYVDPLFDLVVVVPAGTPMPDLPGLSGNKAVMYVIGSDLGGASRAGQYYHMDSSNKVTPQKIK